MTISYLLHVLILIYLNIIHLVICSVIKSSVIISKSSNYTIFHYSEYSNKLNIIPLIASPENWISLLINELKDLDKITYSNSVNINETLKQRAINAYLDFLRGYLVGTSYLNSEFSISPNLRSPKCEIRNTQFVERHVGSDWPYLGKTMIGHSRMLNLQDLLTDVIKNHVTGDFVETGIWRGGASIFAQAIIRSYGESDLRNVFVADSFEGLPPGDASLHPNDVGWDQTPYLSVSVNEVVGNFAKVNLLDKNVIFAKGFFSNTMPHIRPLIHNISILRMDGDLYESTVDTMYHLYDKVSVGGYVIVDDWFGFPAQDAILHFCTVHNISPAIFAIDSLAVYWQKSEQIELQYWRYETKTFI